MSWSRTSAILYRYFCLLRHSPDRLIGLYIWMMIDMVLWGFISHYLGKLVDPGLNIISVFLGAVLLSNFFSRVMLNINMTFFEDMWARNFLNLFASPLRIHEYLGGLIACGVITSTFGLLLVFALAALFFGYDPFVYGPVLLPLLLILFLSGIALGILGCAIVLARGPSSEWFIWPIPAILSPFTGVYYPVDTLPGWMQQVSAILPPTYVFEGLRATLRGESMSMTDLSVGFSLALAYILMAGMCFTRVHRHATRSGLIARYSAENAN